MPLHGRTVPLIYVSAPDYHGVQARALRPASIQHSTRLERSGERGQHDLAESVNFVQPIARPASATTILPLHSPCSRAIAPDCAASADPGSVESSAQIVETPAEFQDQFGTRQTYIIDSVVLSPASAQRLFKM